MTEYKTKAFEAADKHASKESSKYDFLRGTDWSGDYFKDKLEKLSSEITKLKKDFELMGDVQLFDFKREELNLQLLEKLKMAVEGLKKIANYTPVSMSGDAEYWMRRIAKAAIKETEGKK